MTRIAIASDHAGYHLKETLKTHLIRDGYDVRDFGTDSNIPVDYPDYIRPAAISVANGENDFGIVSRGGPVSVIHTLKWIQLTITML